MAKSKGTKAGKVRSKELSSQDLPQLMDVNHDGVVSWRMPYGKLITLSLKNTKKEE